VTAEVSTLIAVIAAVAVHEASAAVLLAACGLAATTLERHIRRRVVADALDASGMSESGAPEFRRERTSREAVSASGRSEVRRVDVQRVAERVMGCIACVVIAGATATLLGTGDVRRSVTVAIAAGFWGIAAGTPLAMLGAVRQAATVGPRVASAADIEALWSVDAVAFDETAVAAPGTVCVGCVHPARDVVVTDLLEAAATAECRIEHPIARAIVTYAAARSKSSARSSLANAITTTTRHGRQRLVWGQRPALCAARRAPILEVTRCSTAWDARCCSGCRRTACSRPWRTAAATWRPLGMPQRNVGRLALEHHVGRLGVNAKGATTRIVLGGPMRVSAVHICGRS
jgi:hypothetical protein